MVVEGSWSDRSARRIVLEGSLAAEEMIVEDFREALGIFLTCLNLFSYVNVLVSMHSER